MPSSIQMAVTRAGQPMTEAQAFKFIVDFVYERSRIRLHDGKEALIQSRLGKRMRLHGFDTLAQYCTFLQTGAPQEELTEVMDALTTNFTHFMREEGHFKFLVDVALPSMLVPGQKKFNIWSAASSSGEEAYSMAFYLMEHYAPSAGWQWGITASDISTKVLEQARRAVYPGERLHAIPEAWRRKYFQEGVGTWAGQYRVKKEVASRVNFKSVNLIENYEHDQKFQVIFCRNVMIYFNKETQCQLVSRLCSHLVPGGYICIGHSESLHGLELPLNCLKPSIYQLITS